MGSDENEEELLRTVALENARSILRARQRAQRELLAAKEALERRTQELAGSLAMLRATLEATFDGIIVIDRAGTVTGFNERYLRLWRIPRELIDAREHQRVLQVCAQQFADPAGYLARVRDISLTSPPESADVLELADGRVYEQLSRIQYVDGRDAGRVWSVRDITERKLAEAQLRDQREWFQVTLASIGDAVITTDTAGRITFLNSVAEAMTGWTAQEAQQLPLERIFNIINEQTRAPVEHPIGKVLRGGSIVGLANHTALIARDGTEISIEDSAAPIRDSRGHIVGAVMVFHDVTARRLAEAALREADRRKDEFLATLAHELRNPLAPIRQAALISKAPAATEAQKRWSHEVIDRQVQHMSLLLDDLLDISRVTRGTLSLRRQPTDLGSVIDAAVETARPMIDARRHTLTVRRTSEPVRFSADPLRVAQVLSNLLTNAAKYTEPGGQIRLGAHRSGGEVSITVADSGIGISAETLPRVFDMFAQVKPSGDRSEGGLGIGLALAKGLVELHGGWIEAHSAGLGRGSEFTVHFPETAEPQPPGPQPDAAPTTPAAAGLRILIAEDNPDSAETLAQLLRLEGHEVMVVHDGPAALAALTQYLPQVALLDIGLPHLDGYEVARRLRERHPDRPIRLIAITGWGQENDKRRALTAGFDHHLTKPVDFARLTELLRS
ncbi:MAG TPA: ATP-binding protein [Steroidobacteraceae bacterium]|jgi:PAS domain S-box-containing protein|nr:ATP-binding protein [Steroidobacteraceae bacterium]